MRHSSRSQPSNLLPRNIFSFRPEDDPWNRLVQDNESLYKESRVCNIMIDDDISPSVDDFGDMLKQLTISRRDPRSIRLAAVASALMDVSNESNATAVSPNQVFAKTVTALEGTLTNLNASTSKNVSDNIATQVALLELLSLTVPCLANGAIVTSTLPLTARVLNALVAFASQAAVLETKDELGGVNALLRWTCRAVAQVLIKIQPSADANLVKKLTMETLLTLMNDKRPKVRKEAASGVAQVLTAAQCHQSVRKATFQYAHVMASNVRKTPNDQAALVEIVHLLSFLETAIFTLPNYSKLLQDVMEVFVVLVQVDASHATTLDFAAVAKVKESTPKILAINAVLAFVNAALHDADETRAAPLNELAPRVLASLLQAKASLVFRVGAADHDLLERGQTLWGQCLLASCSRVVDTKPEIALKLLPLALQVIVNLSKPTESNHEDSSVAQELMVGTTQFFRQSLVKLFGQPKGDLTKCLSDSLANVAHVTDPLYRPTWSVSLRAFALLIQLSHEHIDVKQYVGSLLALRNQAPAGSPSQHAVEEAFASLVQGVGIEVCWGWIDWQPPRTDGKVDMEQSWILSKLKFGMASAQPVAPRLAFFQSDILVAARAYDKIAATAKKNRAFHQARVVDLWALFPYFCTGPCDIEKSLASLTATCARAMEDDRYPQLLAIICHGFKNLSASLEIMQQQNDFSDAITAVMQEASTKLLPALFKLVTTVHQSSMTQANKDDDKMDVDGTRDKSPTSAASLDRNVMEAISALAKVTPKDFLQSLFKKLMHKLLEEIQSDPCDDDKICSYLCLSQALVASVALETTEVSLLYRALKPLIRTDEHKVRVQKRSYKVLFEICQCHHPFIAKADTLEELISLLTDSIATSQVSARHMRLKCMEIIVKGFDEVGVEQVSPFFTATPEILLCLKDTNAKTRSEAMDLLMALASKGGIDPILLHVTAALGAQTTHLRSAAVLALSRLVFEFAWDNAQLQLNLPSLLTTVLVLIDANSREVIRSVIGFIRVSVAAIPPEQLEPLIPELVESLTRFHKPKNRFRAKIKIILKKLVKLFGYDALMPYVPESESRLLTHMRKVGEREARKKEAKKTAREDVTDFDDLLESDEEDSDDGRTFTSSTTRKTALSNKSRLSGKTKGSALSEVTGRKGSAGIRLPSDAHGEIVDMLGVKHTRHVQSAEDKMTADDSDSDGALEFDDDGRLVVRDESEPSPGLVENLPDDNRRKRPRLDSNASKSRQGSKSQKSKQLGSNYKAKKAGGDVKRKGQTLEPYAYVPLDGRQYSKKNRHNAVTQMSSVVRNGSKRKR
ncbi:hypothetical protein MPSEU_000170200 [Mayamaea pseudoterrestris]|nr:hypothetical protein MPSEU_000170200 [Mayamaea pseudoterrestris]